MPSSEDVVGFRAQYPQVLVRGRANTSRMELHRSGVLVEPSAGTYQLLDPDGASVASGDVSVVDDVARFALTAEQLASTLRLGEGYTEVWALTVDGVVRTVRREAGVTRYELAPAFTEADLLLEEPDLVSKLGSVTSVQGFVDAAWARIIRRLFASSQFPDHIVDRSSLVDPHRELTEHLVFRWLARETPEGHEYRTRYKDHEKAWEAAWERVSWRRDPDQTNTPDQTRHTPTMAIIMPNGAPVGANGHRRLPRGW
jgi:hypothetical protein